MGEYFQTGPPPFSPLALPAWQVYPARVNQKQETGTAREILVIGYGNELRGDDGVGPKVVAAVEALQLAGVRTLISQQLSPEHAEPVSQARLVVFVDAAVDAPREVQFRKLEPAGSSQLMAHAADPRTMLALARDVFGHAPEAWWLTIPAEDTGFSEELSPPVRRHLILAVEKIRALAVK